MNLDGYEKVLNEVWDKPPRDVPCIVEDIMSRYPTEVFAVKDIAYMMVVTINDGFYGLSWLCTKPSHQGKGMMTMLWLKAQKKYKGFFIAKANVDSYKWYQKQNFMKIHYGDNKHIMVYCNDRSKIDF